MLRTVSLFKRVVFFSHFGIRNRTARYRFSQTEQKELELAESNGDGGDSFASTEPKRLDRRISHGHQSQAAAPASASSSAAAASAGRGRDSGRCV
jgi:hypothetical protein